MHRTVPFLASLSGTTLLVALAARSDPPGEAVAKIDGVPRQLLFEPETTKLLVLSTDGAVTKISDKAGSAEILRKPSKSLVTLGSSKSDIIVAERESDLKVTLRTLREKRDLGHVQSPGGSITAIEVSGSEMQVFLGTADGWVSVTRVSDGIELWKKQLFHRPIKEDPQGTMAIRLSPDGKWVVAMGLTGGLVVLNREKGEVHACLVKDSLDIWKTQPESMAISPDSRLLLVGSHDGGVALWNIQEATRVWSVQRHQSLVRDLAVSPDGRRVSSVGLDGTCAISEVVDGALVSTEAIPECRLIRTIWTGSSASVFCAAEDGRILEFPTCK